MRGLKVEETFHEEDVHCCLSADPATRLHATRNADKTATENDPHVCCIWHGYKTVVTRVTDPANAEGAAVLRDIVELGCNGVLATFIYTFEVKTPLLAVSKSRWPVHYGVVNRTLRDFCNPLTPLTDPQRTAERDRWLTVLGPFIQLQQSFLLQCLPSVGPMSTFRGIEGFVEAKKYKTRTRFMWPAFTSTSRYPDVAMGFAKVTQSPGSFFSAERRGRARHQRLQHVPCGEGGHPPCEHRLGSRDPHVQHTAAARRIHGQHGVRVGDWGGVDGQRTRGQVGRHAGLGVPLRADS